MMGSFFFMNLFVGVIFMNFEDAQREEKEALFLMPDEIKWVDMIKMILKTKPEIIKRPKNKFSVYLYEKTKGETKFDIFIMICIVLNMILMALSFEGQAEEYTKILEGINYFFTGVFAIESIMKLIGSGVSYFYNSWNKFDFFVVCSSFVDIVMSELGSSLKFLRVGP
jgi:Ion transport protein